MPYDSAPLPSDPVSQACRDAGATSGSRPTGDCLRDAEAIFAGATDARSALDAMLALVRRHPAALRPQLLAVRLLERAAGRAGTIAAWRALHARFPDCPDALLVVLRWILRQEGPAPATLFLSARFPDPPRDPAAMLLLARGLEELGHQPLADAAFARLAAHHPGHELGWIMHAQAEERRGRPWQAQRIIGDGIARLGARPRLAGAAARLDQAMAALDAILPAEARQGGGDVGSLVLARLVERAGAGRGAAPCIGDRLGPIIMLGSSLGAGGAERQMVATAIGLHQARQEGRRIAGHAIGDLRVICRSLDERPGAAFFLPELERHAIPVEQYASMSASADRLARECRDALRFLPPRVAEATARLADALHAARPAVVHLWQDGTILACALAALLARVPRIVLSLRTAPPQDRPERSRPEYAFLYPALAAMPGVVWTANAHFAATRYARCFGLDPGRIRVIPNGVAPPRSRGSTAARAQLSAFDGATGPGFTVGAVMRLDDNKRPLLWLDCAARLLERRPDARFILVGDGVLRAEVAARAAALGPRVLLTGRSAEVGFWLAQMDALLLLSRCEGLPNALLEAQLAGVPVVTTPAGGAGETLRHGETGFVLTSAAAPEPAEVVARLLDIAAQGGRRGPMAQAARRFVGDNFSMSAMLEATVRSYVE